MLSALQAKVIDLQNIKKNSRPIARFGNHYQTL